MVVGRHDGRAYHPMGCCVDAYCIFVCFARASHFCCNSSVLALELIADTRKRASVMPQPVCNDLAPSHKDIFNPYALSSSTNSDPFIMITDDRLERKLMTDNVIHFRLRVDEAVPSFMQSTAAPEDKVAKKTSPDNSRTDVTANRNLH